MPFDWTNYLILAEELAGKADEASKRTAISRAYYFVFNIAFARAEITAGHLPGEYGSHKWCWEKYMGTPDPACRQLGNNGQRMHAKRVRVDYKKGDILRLDEEVRRTLADARQFQIDFANLPPRYPLP